MIKKGIVISLMIVLSSFILADKEYSLKELIGKGTPTFYGDGYQLQKEAHESFLKMQEAALSDGINIEVVSSYRSYEHQTSIWTRKYNRFIADSLSPMNAIKKIIEYSTIPGTSRHHWGTDIDIIDANVERPESVLQTFHFENNGIFVNLKKWMDTNANKFGFYLVYTNDNDRKGFKYEPWHYSYKAISKEMLTQYQKIDIQELLKKDKLVGSDFFTDEFISNYINNNILDINPELKN
ncbi:MAG: M15 family metallopeptidase [Flavobacteriaceae bacterium]